MFLGMARACAVAGVLYLSMSVIAILAAFLRGRYLVGPVVAWSLFFLGATGVDL